MNYKIVFLFNFLSIFKKKKIVIEKDKSKFLKYLNTNELKIYQDHKNLSWLTFLILDIKNPHNKSFIVVLKKSAAAKYTPTTRFVWGQSSEM